jgi:hypothetical protein
MSVERVGDTVRRPTHRRARELAAFLDEVRARGFTGAPRVISADAEGQFVVEYIDGEVLGPPPYRLGEARARSAARLIRAFHDASARTALAGGWDVVAHGDLGPHNLVFRGEAAVAIIDWDEQVGPGTRADDLAHAIWCCADLLDDEVPVREQRLLLEAMCEEYGGIPASVVLDELAARFARAIAHHRGAHRPEAVEIFVDMADRLREARPQLLAVPAISSGQSRSSHDPSVSMGSRGFDAGVTVVSGSGHVPRGKDLNSIERILSRSRPIRQARFPAEFSGIRRAGSTRFQTSSVPDPRRP